MIGPLLLWFIGMWAALTLANIVAICFERPDLLKPKDSLNEAAEKPKGKELGHLLLFGVITLWIWPVIRLVGWTMPWMFIQGIRQGTLVERRKRPKIEKQPVTRA